MADKSNLNWLERGIAAISPSWGLKRAQDRQAMKIVRSYDAASKGRRTSSWIAGGTSANAEIMAAGAYLRNRSRELTRNNPYAKKALQSIVNNTVGRGIKAKIDNEKVQKEFNKWAKKSSVDFNELKNFYGIQKMVMRAVVESGDCLILKRRVKKPKGGVPLELQVVEIDHLDTSKNFEEGNGSYTFMGIEFDKRGKRKAYWLFPKHQGDSRGFGANVSKRIPAEDVIHVFEQLRPSQMVGVPFGVSSFMRVRDMDEYNDAQVMRQKIAACYSVFISRDGSGGVDLPQDEIDDLERIEPAMITVLNGNDKVTFGSPPTVENFAEFSRSILQGVAAGFGNTYENITGDLSNVNFSSGRMGWIEFGRNVEDWQDHILVPMLCDKVFDWWKEAAMLAGINVGDADVNWTSPRREMIDPVKETKGITDGVKAGLSSMPDAIRRMGDDPDEVLAEIEEWNKKLDKLGIILESDPRQKIKAAEGEVGRPSTDKESVDDNEDVKN